MKIAITSSDGVNVDRHFGHTDKFYIYELKGNQFVLSEKRNVDKYCERRGQHEDPEKLKNIYENIKDCLVIYTAMIGDVPADYLKEKGIRARMYTGPIEKIVNYII